jgi:hypothetical protein
VKVCSAVDILATEMTCDDEQETRRGRSCKLILKQPRVNMCHSQPMKSSPEQEILLSVHRTNAKRLSFLQSDHGQVCKTDVLGRWTPYHVAYILIEPHLDSESDRGSRKRYAHENQGSGLSEGTNTTTFISSVSHSFRER